MNEYPGCGVCTIEYYSAIESNVPILATTWMNLKGIRPSERRFPSHDTAQEPKYSDRKQMAARAGEGYGCTEQKSTSGLW